MEIAVKLLFGAILGAAVGLFIARGGCCGTSSCDSDKEKCTTRPLLRIIFSAVAGALFGAAVAWYVINR